MGNRLLARIPERQRLPIWRALMGLLSLHCVLITWVALTAPTPTPWYVRLGYTAFVYFGWYSVWRDRPRPARIGR